MRTMSMMIALSCASILALSVPTFGAPADRSGLKSASNHQSKVKKQNPSRVDRKPRDVDAARGTRAMAHAPKAPALGWPALVKEARKYMGTNPTARDRLWCATFMNMVLAKVGYTGTNSDAARSFAQYGRRISEPRVGAIAVLTRGKNGGHVGVVSGVDGNGNPIVISGNHNKRVGEAIYPRHRVIAYVMPSETTAPATQFADRNATTRRADDGELESPIAELLAVIVAEQSRAESPRPGARIAARPAAPRPAVAASTRPDVPLDPALAEFLGLNDRASPAPRALSVQRPAPASAQAAMPAPQRELRVEQRPSGRVASNGFSAVMAR